MRFKRAAESVAGVGFAPLMRKTTVIWSYYTPNGGQNFVVQPVQNSSCYSAISVAILFSIKPMRRNTTELECFVAA
jgi:hypothetical protein